ncbi:MAG TPA: zinc ribbon domain-containing protein [Gemmatimonadales bacterium]|nr:zinc ribbon domain-containing protein [Gemmatimonadales bacterium]
MPTYEYRCGQCGAEFEKFQKISSKPVASCPECGSKAERLLSAGAGLVFKGSGFYITDYKRSGEKKKESGSESGGESKSSGSGGSAADKPADKSRSRKKED